MKITTRKRRVAVSPVIATLLLIAIAVAAAIIVYAFVTGLIGGLSTGAGSSLVTITGGISVPNGNGAGTLVLSLKNGASNPITTLELVNLYAGATSYYCPWGHAAAPCVGTANDAKIQFATGALGANVTAANQLAVGATASAAGSYTPISGNFMSGTTYTAIIKIAFASGATQTAQYAITAEL